MSPYIPLILLLPVLQGCLVVRTPKCECFILALSSSNIAQNVGNHEFYQNVSGYSLTAPVVKSEDCSVSMYCEGDYSLVVFDKETATMFGAYSADGFCDPRTQKWQVDTETGLASFDRLFGICVDYAPTECACPIHKISNNSIAEELLFDQYFWDDIFSKFQYSEPILNSVAGKCPTDFQCKESGHGKIVIHDEYFYLPDTTFACNPTEQTWEVQALGQPPLGREVEFLGVGCYEIGTCNPEIPCQYKAFDKLSDLKDHFEYKAISQYYSYKAPVVTIDGCSLTMTCDGNYTLIHLDYFDIYSIEKASVSAQCLIGWLWRYPDMETSEFYGICVDLSSKRTTRTPPFATTTPQNKILSRLR
ncbi:unnamed protein product [Caenorhabditis brenneri]